MLSERVRGMTRGLMLDVGRSIARTGLTPNMLTGLGLLMSVLTAGVLVRGETTLGGMLVLLASAFDALDGSVARATERVSPFGAFLDSTLDRVSEAVLYFGLLVYFIGLPDGRQEVALIYLAIVGSLMVSYTRARAEGLGYECKVGWFTRFERVMVLALGLLLGQITIALWLMVIGSWATAVHRMWHVSREAT